MSAEYIPKVGDRVIITKSNINWNDEKMDKYVGLELIISRISRNGDRAQFEAVKGAEAINYWDWNFKQRHFQLVSKSEPEFIFNI